MERERALTAADLDVERVGAGPPVVLVHGSIVDARRTWRRQLELADEWALCMPNRPGFAGSPPLPRGDFELEAPLMAELLGDGALPGWLVQGARLVMAERPPWEADIPLDALAAAPFPKLVVSGDHSAAFEAVCDVLAERVGAERAVIGGRAHTIPSAGAPYNERLRAFLTECEERRSP